MNHADHILNAALEQLELPSGAYENAKTRYESLGKWFSREESSLAVYDPHIFVQGSFALGTATSPLSRGESYDLDLSCKLREKVCRTTHSQAQVKDLVRIELEGYRAARQIQEALEEKHRCWRLYYRDALNFHLDIVPGVPLDTIQKLHLHSAMESFGFSTLRAEEVAELAVYITDDEHPSYRTISDDWQLSNPDGYCKWFEWQSDPIGAVTGMEALVEEVPFYARKTQLQRIVQLLKRHRDVMYRDNHDAKPISIIITTLTALAHTQCATISEALANCLEALSAFAQSGANEVLNPVNPKENFADRWVKPEGKVLNLKENFQIWIDQAKRDFSLITALMGPRLIDHLNNVLAVDLLPEQVSVPVEVTNVSVPTIIVKRAASPWSEQG